MTPEQKYIESTSIEHRKKYAQFFTPEKIAEFMCQWVLQGKQKTRILEPAYGLGIFSRIFAQNSTLPVDAYEIDEKIFTSAVAVCPNGVNLINEDYFSCNWNVKYDAIICNPPYLKFHDYDNATYIPDVNSHLRTKLNGFTNLYTLFLLKSIDQMQDGGRLAYIIPSEFLNSDYGVEVKRALIESNTLQHIIVIDFTECAFDDALTTACIILCEKTTALKNVRFSLVNNIEDLNDCLREYVEYNSYELDANIKWKTYYEEGNSSKYNHLVPFSKFAKVSRGIATGANEFFTFKPSKVDDYNIPEKCLMPCICKAGDAPRTFFTQNEFTKLLNGDKTVYLFNASAASTNINVRKYIHLGEECGIDKRYLTSSRTPWYAIENRPPAPIWVSVFNRRGLRFIRNEANIYNLTTFHCVYPKISGVDIDILFAYLITDVAKDIFLDNSRQYGNGLVKFEPNDLNKGMAVDLTLLNTEERLFVKEMYAFIKDAHNENEGLKLLNEFFTLRYSKDISTIDVFNERFQTLKVISSSIAEKTVNMTSESRIKQLNLLDLFDQYEFEPITQNCMVRENIEIEYRGKNFYREFPIDITKNLLICNVKKDNWTQYLDCSAKFYYTGKKFPTTIALNKLYYFMPYLSGKGIRDLYYIKIARLGYRKEGQEKEDKNDIRLVFEIEYVGQLFDNYEKVKLEIWRTFTDTTLRQIL
ncbi:MAG: N-6 DNA methylase [Muribaculaceae bacterium]|nr:N-6 DNA methylase [Muribaculaceae bacterium]